mmetsp:Transcript_24339/g.61754  ORF Transcript_24339/g.61754 Transcript_24339/m.61754 type:complete len:235 (+) Transcript_24339:497-1201(+)
MLPAGASSARPSIRKLRPLPSESGPTTCDFWLARATSGWMAASGPSVQERWNSSLLVSPRTTAQRYTPSRPPSSSTYSDQAFHVPAMKTSCPIGISRGRLTLGSSILIASRGPRVARPQMSARALEPPKPKDETPHRESLKPVSTTSEQKSTGKPSVMMFALSTLKWQFGGAAWKFTSMMHFVRPEMPAPASLCPVLLLCDPKRTGSSLLPTTASAAPTSIGSPSDVPVPWHSM